MLPLGRWPDMLIMFYQVLQYGQSQYVREFGMHVPTPTRLVELDGRIITAPRLNYNRESKKPTIVCTFHSSRMTIDCEYLHIASRERCMEHVGRFFRTTSLGPYDNVDLERLDRFMSEPVEIPNWLLIVYERWQRSKESSVNRMIADFVQGCVAVGETF